MRPFRFTMLQLLLAATLVALVVGLFSSGWRASRYQDIQQVCFSPSGEYLAARYSGGAVQVWRLENNGPRMVARLFGRGGLFYFDLGNIQFVGDDKLLRVETQFGATPGVEVRQLDVRTRQVTEPAHIDSTSPMPTALAVTGQRVLFSDWNTGAMSSYSLKTGRLERTWTLPSQATGHAAQSADGKTAAVCDDNRHVQVVDLESDRAPIQLSGYSPLAVSSDGRLVATLSMNKAGAIAIHDLSASHEPIDVSFVDFTPADITFTPDNTRLVATDGTKVRSYDLAQKKLGPIIETGDPAPGFYRSHCKLSPNGNQLANVSGSDIVLYDLDGKQRHVFGGDSRLVEIILFTLAFAAWSVIWGLVAKRERLRNPLKPPVRLPVMQTSTVRPVPPMMKWKQQIIWLSVMFVFAVGLMAVMEITGGRSIVGILSDTFFMLAIPIGIVICLAVAYSWLAFLIRGPHQLTLVRLRRLAGDPGRLYREGRLSFWFVGNSRIEPRYKRHLGETLANAEELLGRSIEPRRYRLIACLDRQCDLDAFFGRRMPIAAIIPRLFTDRVGLVCEETAILHLVRPEVAFRSALALSIVIDEKRGFLAGWAALILTQQIVRDGRRAAELRGAIRRLNVLLARHPTWDPRQVFLRSARERLAHWLALDEKHGYREVHAEADMLLTVGEMLLGDGAPADLRQKTLAWLRRITAKDDAIATFTQDVGLSLDELVARWRDWLQARSGLPYDPLPAETRWLLVDVAEPTLENRELPIEQRQAMIRQLGYFSIAGAHALIEALSDEKIELRREAAEALEFVSGELFGDNRPRWQAWWQSLPADVRGEDHHTSMSRMISGAAVSELGEPSEGIAFGPLFVRRSVPSQPPNELKACWLLMIVGGLIALVIPISLTFVAGPVIVPMMYYSLFLGVAAMVHGTMRDTRRITYIARMQLFNAMACDLLNLTLGLIEQLLLRRPHVRQYLLEINSGQT